MLVLEKGIDFEIDKDDGNIKKVEKRTRTTKYCEYIKIDRDKSTFKSHRDFDSEIEMTFKHF